MKKCNDKRENKAGGGEMWIQKATENKGALHRKLGIPQGEKIPAKKLEKAEHSKNLTLRREANLASTLKKINKARSRG